MRAVRAQCLPCFTTQNTCVSAPFLHYSPLPDPPVCPLLLCRRHLKKMPDVSTPGIFIFQLFLNRSCGLVFMRGSFSQ